jgi:hypothetical protein
MKDKIVAWPRRAYGAPKFSPPGFTVMALAIAVIFGVCHAAGWREHTTLLSGTPASAEKNWRFSEMLGVTYMVAYFGFVLLVPILLLAAGILAGWQRCLMSSGSAGAGSGLSK